MDISVSITAIIGLIFTGLVSIAWFLIQRQIAKNDTESDKEAENNKEKFKEQGTRIGAVNDRLQQVELAMANKVGRDELDKIYDKLDEVKKDWKEDMKELKDELLAALATHKGI